MAQVALVVAVLDHDAAGIEVPKATAAWIGDLLTAFRDECRGPGRVGSVDPLDVTAGPILAIAGADRPIPLSRLVARLVGAPGEPDHMGPVQPIVFRQVGVELALPARPAQLDRIILGFTKLRINPLR